jgi:hypothetical protein
MVVKSAMKVFLIFFYLDDEFINKHKDLLKFIQRKKSVFCSQFQYS